MTQMEQGILADINIVIREEKGTRVTLDSTLLDADLDSFGTTVLFLDMDTKYEIFADVPADVDPFKSIDWNTFTIRELVDKCL